MTQSDTQQRDDDYPCGNPCGILKKFNPINKLSLILGIALIGTAISCTNPETIQPETKSVMEAVYASGFLEAVGQVELRSQTEGVLLNELGTEGEKVENGQVLFTISGLALDSRLRAAQ
ncbi:MAG TPA: hypothetical protein VLA71_16410, partial [Algoriphagus sp.]|nr:hypothetical protein [Algoriphagus sp.]